MYTTTQWWWSMNGFGGGGLLGGRGMHLGLYTIFSGSRIMHCSTCAVMKAGSVVNTEVCVCVCVCV